MVRFSWLTFDEDYGSVPAFWFGLNRLGQRGIGEVRANSRCWATRPHCRSSQAAHASKRVDNVCRHSPVFTQKKWRTVTIKDTTRGPMVWEIKTAQVHSPAHLAECSVYYQERNAVSYKCRRRRGRRKRKK